MDNYNPDDFRLSIIEPATYYSKSGTSYRAYLCQCKCGNKKIVKRSDFLNKRVRSCGCLVTDFNKTKVGNSYSKFRKSYRNNFIHNPKPEHYERIKRIWKNMKSRCGNPNATSYRIYGGRGIAVCDEWKNDFMNFYNWAIANGYSDDLSIDRIDNDKGYCPSNCRWATAKEQRANQRKL